MRPDTHKNSTPCFLWILAILTIGAILWYLLYSFATAQKALAIEEDISARSTSVLATQAALVNVSADADGRDVVLTGSVGSEQAQHDAEQIVLAVNGVRSVQNSVEIAENSPQTTAAAPEFVLRSSAKVDPLPTEFPELAEEAVKEAPSAKQDIAVAQQSIDQLDLDNISFLHGSATLTDDASTTLNAVVQTLSQHTNIKLHVEGHTDNTGDPNYNLDLSTKRAQSVVDYLVAEGIDNTRLVASGFGDRQPITTNETKEGRSKNRRIEFKLINGEN